MNKNPSEPLLPEIQTRSLLLFMVVAGYIVTFISSRQYGTVFSPLELILGLLFGALYILFTFFDRVFFGRLPWPWLFFFTVQCGLVFGIGWLLGPGGHWLIGIPLAGIAVEKLSPRWRWPVYAGMLAAIILPIGLRHSDWNTALYNTLIIGAAIFFVAVFTEARLGERNARLRAEQLARQLEQANHRLAEYAAQAEDLATVRERNRLAREIHDNLGHTLTIVNVQIEAARAVLGSDPQKALEALGKAQELSRTGLARVRESVAALRESPLEAGPFPEVLSALVDETRAAGLQAGFTVEGSPRELEPKVALALYRVTQEALTNVRKHANASRVDVTLDFREAGRIQLEVRDDGAGAADTGGGFGLVGIRERVQLLGGACQVDTAPGRGFRLRVGVPDRAHEQAGS